jgi:hypothetical protein
MSRRGAECCACLVWTKGKNGEVFGGYLAEGEREGGNGWDLACTQRKGVGGSGLECGAGDGQCGA